MEAYPNAPGFKASGTSEAAAMSMAASAMSIRDQVLRCVQESLIGLTPDECAKKLKLTVLTVRPRFTELQAKGLIVKSGEKRRNASKKMAVVWKAASA